ncbi:related to transcription factor IIIB [Phialocephala subalpina]|uniref:Related to transcription factor IIIB n=1 Tax=Phialocephala subalpina TaxID=576137 RepID=A0A1L7XA59_9HELO|nr:related to transcription factor IIIB [Phialocephala subalpina]
MVGRTSATPAPRPNPIRNRVPIKNAPPRRANTPVRVPKPKCCPNTSCNSFAIDEGICTECGTIVDETNIVSEISFGETSSGQAVVQGTYISADQGGANTSGPNGRGGGQSARDLTLHAGRRIMNEMQAHLGISNSTADAGHQIFKLAATANFIQGRRLRDVAVVCLYSACRKSRPCKVMLIDFADKIQINVFKLGTTFKALHKLIPITADGIMPILPEDLIHRFAVRLDFGNLTDKVAEDAVRMAKRMSLDWMVMGRRPSGVCGACLILAARMNNFRRTVTEVVYIVKVTTHTIQKRLEEFKLTPSSALTVEEFLHNEFLESAHDPPSFYEKTEEFQKTLKKRRKRKGNDALDTGEGSGSENGSPNKRQKTATPAPDQQVELRRDADGFAIPPRPVQPSSTPAAPSDPESNIDPSLRSPDTSSSQSQSGSTSTPTAEHSSRADAAPQVMDIDSPQTQSTRTPLPTQPTSHPASETPAPWSAQSSDSSVAQAQPTPSQAVPGPDNRPIQVSDEWSNAERQLEEEISEMINDPNTMDHAKNYAIAKKRAAAHMIVAERTNPQKEVSMDVHIGEEEFADDPEKGPDNRPIQVSDEWSNAERQLEEEISEMINDPNTMDHAKNYAIAKKRAAAHMIVAERTNPQKEVSMDVHIGEEEFADDPEVMNCLLSEEDSAHKETLWINENKHWLRKQQLREWEKRKAEEGPPKLKRNRKKKMRMGQNQTEPAASPGDAAAAAVKRHAFSKKINYDAIGNLFDKPGVGNALGSAATSRVTSQAGSELGSETSGSRQSSLAPSEGFRAPTPIDLFPEPAYARKRRIPGSRSSPASRSISASPMRAIAPRPSAEASPAPLHARPSPAPSEAPSETLSIDMGDTGDYNDPNREATPSVQGEAADDWRKALKKPTAEGEEEEHEEEYDDYDDGEANIEPGGLGDFDNDDGGGFQADEDMDDYE